MAASSNSSNAWGGSYYNRGFLASIGVVEGYAEGNS